MVQTSVALDYHLGSHWKWQTVTWRPFPLQMSFQLQMYDHLGTGVTVISVLTKKDTLGCSCRPVLTKPSSQCLSWCQSPPMERLWWTHFPTPLTICVIHQQGVKEVMDVSMNIAWSIRARSLYRQLFSAYLEEADCNHTDLLLHIDVRWLSRSKLLQKLWELLPEIREFLLSTKSAEY